MVQHRPAAPTWPRARPAGSPTDHRFGSGAPVRTPDQPRSCASGRPGTSTLFRLALVLAAGSLPILAARPAAGQATPPTPPIQEQEKEPGHRPSAPISGEPQNAQVGRRSSVVQRSFVVDWMPLLPLAQPDGPGTDDPARYPDEFRTINGRFNNPIAPWLGSVGAPVRAHRPCGLRRRGRPHPGPRRRSQPARGSARRSWPSRCTPTCPTPWAARTCSGSGASSSTTTSPRRPSTSRWSSSTSSCPPATRGSTRTTPAAS
ncbi:MAG: hypothetical protein KatS3mg103_1088 [Phycisphaerales bacterium]|nr:MAG: hypothetical protein KatS3mg103_1088 [Phycisphaerales bacterium]